MRKPPRTPVFWPRMKVRGRRNRAKLAARYERRTVVPMMRLSQPSPTQLTLVAVTAWKPNTYRVEVLIVHDGYGRQIGRAKTTARPVPNPNPPQSPDDVNAFIFSIMGARRLYGTEEAPPDAT